MQNGMQQKHQNPSKKSTRAITQVIVPARYSSWVVTYGKIMQFVARNKRIWIYTYLLALGVGDYNRGIPEDYSLSSRLCHNNRSLYKTKSS